MAFLAGETITAGRLQRLQPTPYAATGTSNLTLASTETDVPGASITLTSETNGALYVCQAVFSFDIVTDTTDRAEGILHLDGTQVSGNARWAGQDALNFAMAPQQWQGALGSAGEHTLKLRGFRSTDAAGRIDVLGAFTKIQVTVYEEV